MASAKLLPAVLVLLLFGPAGAQDNPEGWIETGFKVEEDGWGIVNKASGLDAISADWAPKGACYGMGFVAREEFLMRLEAQKDGKSRDPFWATTRLIDPIPRHRLSVQAHKELAPLGMYHVSQRYGENSPAKNRGEIQAVVDAMRSTRLPERLVLQSTNPDFPVGHLLIVTAVREKGSEIEFKVYDENAPYIGPPHPDRPRRDRQGQFVRVVFDKLTGKFEIYASTDAAVRGNPVYLRPDPKTGGRVPKYDTIIFDRDDDQKDTRKKARELIKEIYDKAAPKKAMAEPGGILFEGRRAEDLALQLSFRSVHYDPISGRLILAGEKSEEVFDVETFTTALRLAVEQHDPFFSLDPVDNPTFDGIPARAFSRLQEKHGALDALLSSTMIRPGRERRLPGRPDRAYYFAPLSAIDGDVYREVTSPAAARVRLVFSPEWLQHTQPGWILYEADVAIKAIATGLLRTEEGLDASAVWNIKDYEPDWATGHRSSVHAGRANFELDPHPVPYRGGSLNLSDVKPKLVMVHREPGTSRDLEPCGTCLRISLHVSEHWEEYARAVPVFAELAHLFRAYVGARFLVNRFPGLAARLLSTASFEPETIPPWTRQEDPLIWICVKDGKLIPVRDGETATARMGIGISGGVTLKTDGLTFKPAGGAIAPWTQTLLTEGREGYHTDGSDAAVILRIAGPTLGHDHQIRWWGILVALSMVLGAVVFALRFRLGAVSLEAIGCGHCKRIHRITESVGWLTDTLACGTFMFLLSLPFVAAGFEGSPTLPATASAVGLLAVALIGLGVMAGFAQMIVMRWAAADAFRPSLMRSVGAAARWGGAFLGVFMIAGGLSDRAASERVLSLLGVEVGERVLATLGGGHAIVAASLCLLGCAAAALLIRWIVPWTAGSRPLLLARRA